MSDEQLHNIPTPWHLQWRRVRYQLVPVVSLVLCLLATGWLWSRRLGTINTYGRVQVTEVNATSHVGGLLVPLVDRKEPIKVYERVEAQQVVARLDDASLTRELTAAEQELDRLRQELARRQAENATGAQAPLPPPPAGAARPATQPALRIVGSLDAFSSMTTEQVREAIGAQEARIEDIEYRLDSLEIRSPITGRVTSITAFPGQSIIPGQVIMTIASETGENVVTYIRREQRINLHRNMPVTLRSPLEGTLVSAEVTEIGPRVEAIPTSQLRDPRILEWGTPVLIKIPPAVKFRPGDTVEVRFRNASAPGLIPTVP